MKADTLPVNEIFETIQGEAGFTGTPAVFIRLQGCPVGCGWCDTKHTWHVDEKHRLEGLRPILIKDRYEQIHGANSFAHLDIDTIMEGVQTFAARHVVITGGEPCLYDLRPLTERLVYEGCRPQVETSGTEEILVHPATWVTVSPKIDMPGGRQVLESALIRANEIKFPVGKMEDIKKLQQQVADKVGHATIWLQPLSQSNSATTLCIEQASINGWRVSFQVHKFVGLR